MTRTSTAQSPALRSSPSPPNEGLTDVLVPTQSSHGQDVTEGRKRRAESSPERNSPSVQSTPARSSPTLRATPARASSSPRTSSSPTVRSSSPSPPPSDYAVLREHRAHEERAARSANPPPRMVDISKEKWGFMLDALTDIVEGRGNKHLEEWDASYNELSELLDECDDLKRETKRQRREIKRLTVYCQSLERRLGIDL